MPRRSRSPPITASAMLAGERRFSAAAARIPPPIAEAMRSA